MISKMRTSDFEYELPNQLIAQMPAPKRDHSRLLLLDRKTHQIAHRQFLDLPEYLRPGDVLVLNDTRVIRARLRGVNAKTGGEFEILLLEECDLNDWWAMLRPGKRARIGTEIHIVDRARKPSGASATVIETNEEGHRRLRFSGTANISEKLQLLGETPVPPYISRADAGRTPEDVERYQTIYARETGSVAAPTAGLHFTESLLAQTRSRGVEVCFLTLHLGLGTFAPVKVETLTAHKMHRESYSLSEATAGQINEAKSAGRRVVAVGTTTLRVLESVAQQNDGRLRGGKGTTQLFVYPPYHFNIVDVLLTNFHLPRSTLLMLVSAFATPDSLAGREIILAAYREAIQQRYRFFSYGDAMLIL
ncbi:MAG TPA: tRNA preQ1(34) S-adenosylmethionine ribosyltransferase-isomerase QueA [Candidatus Limnocylindrales bacterium]|jgi:S-adenosylmethionine:tRNA ribosyltransferase-isomerase|nr:tRNA preQ1(34) S-adenosylmethionine ribosyltransferase-isomerase QueA [Candidatus Limnocylindrales bacterium]